MMKLNGTSKQQKECSVEGCIRSVRGRGLCGTCWARWKRNGDPNIRIRDMSNTGKSCTVENCEKTNSSKGFCMKHYGRWRRYGDPLKSKRSYYTVNHPALCCIKGCKNLYEARGLCKNHHGQMRAKETSYDSQKIWRRTPIGKANIRAHSAANYAIKTGKLKRSPCEVCGSIDNINAHHDSYLKEDYLNIRWLCFSHHKEWHKNNKPKYPPEFGEYVDRVVAFAGTELGITIPAPNQS